MRRTKRSVGARIELSMVPLFVGYALSVWYFAGLHRRRIAGAVSVGLGMAGLLCLNWFHVQLGEWTKCEIYVPGLQTITYPYTDLVVVVGGFIWAIPRYRGERCGTCGYSLEGLEPVRMAITCPECGTRHAMHGAYRPSGADRRRFDTDDDLANTRVPLVPGRAGSAGDESEPSIVVRLDPSEAGVGRAGSSAEDAPEPADGEDSERQPADERPAERAEAAL